MGCPAGARSRPRDHRQRAAIIRVDPAAEAGTARAHWLLFSNTAHPGERVNLTLTLSCDDGNSCTSDVCLPASGCANPAAPDGLACDAGATCLGGVCGGVAAITNVALDHTDRLGATIPLIAREKAAILERGDLGVTGASGEGLAVIRRRARRPTP